MDIGGMESRRDSRDRRGRNTKYSGRDSALRKPEMQDTAAVRPQSFIKMRKVTLMLVFVLCAGCLTPTLFLKKERFDNFYTIPGFTEFKIRDVGFAGFTSQVPLTGERSAQINEIFVTELRKRNWYRVHLLRPEEVNDFGALSRLDAVITGEILSYKDMKPLNFGLTLSMKYLNTGQTLWSAAHIFDATTKEVVNAIKYYYYKNKDEASPLWKHKAYLISINKFIEFCCNTLIDTIEEGWERECALEKGETGGKK
jgi:hypothetical protein